jgi:hypothetical protein
MSLVAYLSPMDRHCARSSSSSTRWAVKTYGECAFRRFAEVLFASAVAR